MRGVVAGGSDAVTSADSHQHCYKTTPQLMLECLQDTTTTQQLMLECFMLCATTMLASTSVSAPC